MEFINEDSYTIIYKYNKLNQKINIDALEIKNLEKKKKGNQTVLDIQENIFYTIIEKKCKILKKYKFNIIKNAINYNKNKQIINLIYKLIKNNNNELLLLQNNKLIKNNLYNNNINIEKNKLILLDKLILLNKLINENNYDKLYNLGYELNIWYKLPPQKTFGKESKTEFRIQDVVDGKIIFLESFFRKKIIQNLGLQLAFPQIRS